MTALVTGGAGFIGANFIFYWLRTHPGDRVVCVDKLTYAGNLSVLKAALENPAFRFVKADICDREAMDRLFGEERPDAVVNFAAESHVARHFVQAMLHIKSLQMKITSGVSETTALSRSSSSDKSGSSSRSK